jgi:DNA-binding ferritin-like protein
MTYEGIVIISNEIRYVLDTARQVNLAAQNASLAARRAGNVRGFQAVSAELKLFSQGLATAMHEMSQDIHGIAQLVSSIYRHQRYAGYFAQAARQTGEAGLLTQVRAATEQRHHQILDAQAERLQRLEGQLVRSVRICSNGRALARSAMIEAASGGEWEQMLKNVAGDIEHTIADVHERLKLIGNRLNLEQTTS